jgi:hypothetical protein
MIILIILAIQIILKNELPNIILKNIHAIHLSDYPFKLFLYKHLQADEAFNAERQMKKWNRQKKEALIAENFFQLSLLAKKKFN